MSGTVTGSLRAAESLTGTLEFDEKTMQTYMVTADGSRIPCASASGTLTVGELGLSSASNYVLTYDQSKGAGWQLNSGGSVNYAEREALLLVNKLLAVIELTSGCRCAPTEVCPDCHDLNAAVSEVRAALAQRDLVLGGTTSYSGNVTLPANTLSVSTNSTAPFNGNGDLYVAGDTSSTP